jgi:hypothetical protein
MFEPDPAAAPGNEPLVATVHANVVPATLLVSAIEVVWLEQIVCAAGVAVTTGLGLTVTVTFVGVADPHELADGVIEYVAVCVVFDELVSVCEIEPPDPAEAPVSVPELVATVQLNVEPATLLDNTIPVTSPEHIIGAAGVAVAVGVGLTVMVTVIGAPGQVLAVGVIVYVAVCATVEVLVKVWAIVEPDPAAAPVNDPLVETVQANVVPATGLVNAIEVVCDEQIVWATGVAVAAGVGLTVITTVVGVEAAQALADGVIVYVAVWAVFEEFVSVCPIEFPDPALAPVNVPALVVTVHENVEPATLLVNAIAVVLPEQIVDAAGVAVATGIGFTVITTVIGVVPAHALAEGVIV